MTTASDRSLNPPDRSCGIRISTSSQRVFQRGQFVRASIPHDFYTDIERILIRIAEELNGGGPRSDQWHRQLLTDMTLEIPGVRPAAVTATLVDSLLPFLRFRHLLRDLSGFALDPDRVPEIEGTLWATYDVFVAEVEGFLEWMTG